MPLIFAKLRGRPSGPVAKVVSSHELGCDKTVTIRAHPLQATSAAPTLAEAMEPLRLFIPETLEALPDEVSEQTPWMPSAVPLEHLQAAETFLQARSDNREALATIQAAILLCEGAGDVSEDMLESVRVDDRAFPLAAGAVRWTRDALNAPRASWPEGFWPRFLLGVLSGEQPGR